ncbi:MAG TPA: acetyl-CoA carboxylase biotin carboxylase subunit, partial [Planctomycetota bacterium]|nr:acetyl-CoA carboxylase biotin carboxylase subunit [Planctomycetota bacterium]
RLQVEHPVTEALTGLDLVRMQIAVAAGERLGIAQEDVRFRGHAIEARICAEDPSARFAPSTGRVEAVRFPAGPFVRVDSDLAAGSEVTVYYDSLIAKVIAWGEDRPRALNRLARALREFAVVGPRTTIPFHLGLLEDPRFREGRVHTRFVDDGFELPEPAPSEDAALAAVLLEALRRERATPSAVPRPLPPWTAAFREDR